MHLSTRFNMLQHVLKSPENLTTTRSSSICSSVARTKTLPLQQFCGSQIRKTNPAYGYQRLVSIFSPSSKCLQHTGWRENPLGHMPLRHPIHQSWPKFQFLPAQTRKVKRSVRSQRTMRITSYYIHIIESHGNKMMQMQDACLKCLQLQRIAHSGEAGLRVAM